jgi:hypothetical protein
MYSDHFDVLMSKVKLKKLKKDIISIYFHAKIHFEKQSLLQYQTNSKDNNLSNLYIFNKQRHEGLLMDQHILYMLFFLKSMFKRVKCRVIT